MNEREYMRLRRRLHDDHKKKLEALDLVWAMSNPTEPAPKVKKKRPKPTASGEPSGGTKTRLTAVVSAAVAAMPTEFSTKDVDRWIVANHGVNVADRSSISHALKRLRSVKLIEPGRGKRASTYQKLATDPSAAAADNCEDAPSPSQEEQHTQIRTLARAKQLDATKFRDEVLVAKYSVSRLADLSFSEAQEVIELLSAS